MKVSKLLLLCALFGVAHVLNADECSPIGTVRYFREGKGWDEFEIIKQWHNGKRLEKIDCSYSWLACRPMGQPHQDNVDRINNLEAYMDQFKRDNPGIISWHAFNRSNGPAYCRYPS
jgi:hypothetical protein